MPSGKTAIEFGVENADRILRHTFLGIDVPVYGFLADPQPSAFKDHPFADLFWRPAIFQPLDDTAAQLRMTDQLALPRAPAGRHQLGCGAIIAITFRQAGIREMVPLQLPEYHRSAAPKDARDLVHRDLRMALRGQVGGFFDYGGTFSSLKNGQMTAFAGIGDWITGVLEKNGANVRTAIPEEGGLQWTESFSIGKGSRNQEMARKWIQYITSPEGQAKSADMAAYPALIPNKKGWVVLNEANPAEAKRQNMISCAVRGPED